MGHVSLALLVHYILSLDAMWRFDSTLRLGPVVGSALYARLELSSSPTSPLMKLRLDDAECMASYDSIQTILMPKPAN